MAGTRSAGPMCQVANTPQVLDDGTLCRCASPLPGSIGAEPDMLDQFAWPLGGKDGKPLGEEAWFEKRYPNLMEDARMKFVDAIEGWVQANWGQSPFKEKVKRISIAARDTVYRNADNTIRRVTKSDNRFERCGDTPQTPHEADKVLGSFAIDIETPVTITYATLNLSGRMLQAFSWNTILYVEDVLGLQEDNLVVQKLGNWTMALAPSRRVIRARWKIAGTGISYVVAAGETLFGIAAALCGDQRKAQEIQDLNKGKIANPHRLQAGMRLILSPELIAPAFRQMLPKLPLGPQPRTTPQGPAWTKP